MSEKKMEFKIISRIEGQERVSLEIEGLVWNELAGPMAVALIRELDRRVLFTEKERTLLREMFSVPELGVRPFAVCPECMGDMSPDELDEFLAKVQ